MNLLAAAFESGIDVSLLEQEIICVSGGRCKHDDGGNDPMLKEASGRGIQRPVASPYLREWQCAFAT
jgi:hypothetical protein